MSETRTIVVPVGPWPDFGLPPAALARHVDVERRRELARALHAPWPRARGITSRLEVMRDQIAHYRAQAIALHARLVELEAAGNDNVGPLRRTLIESSVQIESVVRSLVGIQPSRWPRATESFEPVDDDWPDEPTLRRAR